MEFVVESDVIIRAVDKPFNERQILGSFCTSELAYQFIEKYLQDTKELHTYFSRNYLCPKDEYEERIREGRIIAINVVLGQFEDMIYVRKCDL
jgi:predicted adenine nucleotide alpha hydrolase (AANH) superfamily ATPase